MPDSIDDIVTRVTALEADVSTLKTQEVPTTLQGATDNTRIGTLENQVAALAEQVANLPTTAPSTFPAPTDGTTTALDDHRIAWVDAVLHKWFANDAPMNPVASPAAASIPEPVRDADGNIVRPDGSVLRADGSVLLANGTIVPASPLV